MFALNLTLAPTLIENIGRPAAYLFAKRAGHQSRLHSRATLCHSKKSKFSFTKTSRWKFLDLKPTHFAVKIAAPQENNRSTTEELGERVLYFRNTSTQICRYIES